MQSVLSHFEQAVQEDPDALLLTAQGEGTLTYGSAARESERLAAALSSLGVSKGDRLAALLDNGGTPVITFLACLQLGAIFVPLNTALSSDFIAREVENADPRVLIADVQYMNRFDRRTIDSSAALDAVILNDRAVGVQLPLEDWGKLVLSYTQLLSGANGSFLRPSIDPEATACILYTSGTLGDPKGCVISHNYLCHTATQAIERSGRSADEILWTPLPLFHINALASSLVSSIIVGGQLSIGLRFSASRFWTDVRLSEARVAHLLGGLMNIIASHPDTEESRRCFGQLRFVAGVPCSARLRRQWTERFGVAHIGTGVYGMTEACQITTTPYGEAGPEENAGRITAAFDVKIFDEHDMELPVGDIGEIVCRPKTPHIMFEGYWRKPAETLGRIGGLWFHTRDRGWLDRQGWLHFAGRGEDVIRRLGENFPAIEIERVLMNHPAVNEAVAIGIASDFGDEEVCAVVVPVSGAELSADELHRHAKESLPTFAVPRFIVLGRDLPRNAVGKVVKSRLTEDRLLESAWDARDPK